MLAVFGFNFIGMCSVLLKVLAYVLSGLVLESLLARCVRGAWSLEEHDFFLLFSHT